MAAAFEELVRQPTPHSSRHSLHGTHAQCHSAPDQCKQRFDKFRGEPLDHVDGELGQYFWSQEHDLVLFRFFSFFGNLAGSLFIVWLVDETLLFQGGMPAGAVLSVCLLSFSSHLSQNPTLLLLCMLRWPLRSAATNTESQAKCCTAKLNLFVRVSRSRDDERILFGWTERCVECSQRVLQAWPTLLLLPS